MDPELANEDPLVRARARLRARSYETTADPGPSLSDILAAALAKQKKDKEDSIYTDDYIFEWCKRLHRKTTDLIQIRWIESTDRHLIPYPFADIPERWSVEGDLSITDRRIKRKGSDYSLSVNSARNLWNYAKDFWAGNLRVGMGCGMTVAANDYRDQWCDVDNDSIKVGCQRIRRYELEQVALHLGWEFPAVSLPV